MRGGLEEVLNARNIPFQKNVKTAALCTFRIGGTAALLLTPRCRGELIESIRLCRLRQIKCFPFGAGSNLLFDDGHLDTVLIRTTGLDAVRILPSGISADCGVRLGVLAAKAAREGLSGLEFAAGIPGTLGGAIFMNAGADGGEMANIVTEIDVYDPDADRCFTLAREDAAFAYRKSRFQQESFVILGARLALLPDDSKNIFERTYQLLKKRREKQPTAPSAGSAFRRPAPDVALSRIFDELGLKGLSVGGALVSPKHAGFIVNNGSATAGDVCTLIKIIQDITEKEKGFRPIPEIRLVKDER